MTNEHPITPPPELVEQWLCAAGLPGGPLEQASKRSDRRLQNDRHTSRPMGRRPGAGGVL
jgi:hypothetical protein